MTVLAVATAPTTAAVTLRINVAPTAIEFDEGDAASGALTGLINAYTASTTECRH